MSLTRLVKKTVLYLECLLIIVTLMFIFGQLAIKAEDLGSPPRSSLKTITIALENIDDNVPVFTEVQAS